MAKFCEKCGAQLEDNATFCTACGATQGQPAQAAPQQAAPAQGGAAQGFAANMPKVSANDIKEAMNLETIKNLPKTKDKKTIAILGCAALLVIIVLIILFSLIFGGGYKSPLDDFCKGFNKSNSKMMLKTTMPDDVFDAYVDENDPDWDDMDDSIDAMKKLIGIQYGDDVEISYKVTDKSEISKSKLKKQYKSQAKAWAKAADGSTSDYYPTAGYELEVEFTIEGDDDEDTEETTVKVGKVDGDWIILDGGAFDSLTSGSSSLGLDDLDDIDLDDYL